MTSTLVLAYLSLTAPVAVRDATVYADFFEGRRTADGTVYRHESDIAASNDFPLGTRLVVRHEGREVRVTVRDRMHRRFTGRRIDLSGRAWRRLSGNRPPGVLRDAVVSKSP